MALRIARTTTTGESLPTLKPKSGNTSLEDVICEIDFHGSFLDKLEFLNLSIISTLSSITVSIVGL